MHPADAGMLNSIGLQNPGVDVWLEHELPSLLGRGATVVASIWGFTVEAYEQAARMLAAAPAEVVAVEVNLSCPNIEDRRKMFAHVPACVRDAMEASAACGRPRWAKLSPNVTDITEVASAVIDGGAAALTLINTVMGMAIDPATREYRLGAGGGGLSGPAIRPVAVRLVHECHNAFPDVPIVGVGGIATGVHAAELLVAGASAVQVGTATFADPRADQAVCSTSLAAWCSSHDVRRVADLTATRASTVRAT